MRHLTRLCLILGLAALVQGCQTSLPGSGAAPGDGVTPNAVLGGEIEVVPLDAPPPDPTVAPPEGAATAAAQAGAPDAAAVEAPAPIPDLPADPGNEAPDADTLSEDTAEPAPPSAPKSEAQLACEKKRGQWVATGLGALRTCVFTTRDGGKRCTRESDCEGACLARSGTCAPIRPLLGCNEILQDNGARVTLCVE